MVRTRRIDFIQEIAKNPAAFDDLEKSLSAISKDGLSEELLDCGIIPERFKHDSSEEKLWAKYCDILLSHAFNHIGINARVIRARGDSADVFGETPNYTIVADAKAFRLSRTAKNQKDFKISALDDWRKEDTYACLVSPLYQYPSQTSQIYSQAEAKNVTLLSYVHLKFLVDFTPNNSLIDLWNVPSSVTPSKDARTYWEHIDDVVVALTNKSYQDLRRYKQIEVERTQKVGQEGIAFWQSVIESYSKLSKAEAVKRLIQAEKIEQKIHIIQKTIDMVSEAFDE